MADSRRILITGLASHWGGRLAQELEQDDRVEAIVGIDMHDPRHELRRTEFVRVSSDEELLGRIIRAAQIDTVIDTGLIPDTFSGPPRPPGATGLDGLLSVLAAAGGGGSPIRKLVVKSSAKVYGPGREGPAFFTEEMPIEPPRSALERDLARAERLLGELAGENPQLTVTVLRCAEAIGGQVRGAHLTLLGLPVVPTILGFDPRWQFVHESDIVGVLRHAVANELPGAYNVAADGVLALSEVVSLLGKALLPVLPPWGSVFAAIQLRRLGLPVPIELLRDLRHGRGLDNRRLKTAGYSYRFTTREAVLELRSHQRLRPLLGSGERPYRYEREVEEFLRWSPSVRGARIIEQADGDQAGPPAPDGRPGPDAASGRPAGRLGRPAGVAPGYGDLTEDELLEIIPSLAPAAIQQLRDHEASGPGRQAVLAALEHELSRSGGADGG